MGINICLQTMDGKEHPDWDFGRYGGDRDFLSDLYRTDRIKIERPDSDDLFRPLDIEQWRAAAKPYEHMNPGRLKQMLDIIEREPEYWVYVSY